MIRARFWRGRGTEGSTAPSATSELVKLPPPEVGRRSGVLIYWRQDNAESLGDPVEYGRNVEPYRGSAGCW
jgi:hypothetical protein